MQNRFVVSRTSPQISATMYGGGSNLLLTYQDLSEQTIAMQAYHTASESDGWSWRNQTAMLNQGLDVDPGHVVARCNGFGPAGPITDDGSPALSCFTRKDDGSDLSFDGGIISFGLVANNETSPGDLEISNRSFNSLPRCDSTNPS